MSERLFEVATNHCPCCGRVKPIWTPAAIVAAMQAWARDHGRPPRSTDWLLAAPGHPSVGTVQNVFGRWARAITAAGLKRVTRREVYWTRERIADAFLDFKFAHGRWPAPRDFLLSTPSTPGTSTVYNAFPSWSAALDAAGRAKRAA